ncbi:twin-arginine translocation signal domain-containing protein [Allorhizocola rhizosphaerae]|uniref:twin-arginine translocation signal domain-containing protein n=1 Tax=Allorhizocola rhizosphaerae TaxID=1872709 RepID=UPI000E3EDB45|nr:twin-arginine translocation signal domain-containing protein [Allorhizocola rhizosphaerae]
MTNEVSRRQFIAAATLAGGALALTIPAAAQARDLGPAASPAAVHNLEVWLLSTSPR